MKRQLILILTGLFLFSFPLLGLAGPVPGPVAPSAGEHAPVPVLHHPNTGKAVIIIMDRTSIHDWVGLEAPTLKRLAEKYAVGFMNCKTGGGGIPEDSFLTFGTGVPVRAPGTGDDAFSAAKNLPAGTATQVYTQRTGQTPPPEAIIQTDIARIHRLNEDSPYSVKPGTLGRVLHSSGMKTAVLGNSDSVKGFSRPGTLVAMDEKGIVDTGAVGEEILLKDPRFPGGMRTHYDQLLEDFNSLPPAARLVVIELGDFSRIEDASSYLFPEVVTALRKETMQRCDNFLAQLLEYLDLQRDLLVIASLTPNGHTVTGDNMITPVLVAGNGLQEGLLYSPTTKRPGIIRNTDILPTVLNFLGTEIPYGLTGQPIQVMPGDYKLTSLANLHDELATTHHLRRPVLQNYVLIQLLLLGASLLFIFWKKVLAVKILQPLILAVMTIPLVMLVLPLMPGISPAAQVSGLLILAALLTFIATRSQRSGILVPLLVISSLTSVTILLDLLLGAPLQKSSLLGYDPIMGARFYGLGNEYMGILLGSTLIATTTAMTLWKDKKIPLLAATGIYYVVTVFITGSPGLGTNVGGTIASVGAFLFTFMLLAGGKINRRTVGLICTGLVTVLGAFILYDASRPPELQSHIGRTASLILSGGVAEIFNIISRKVAINIKLIRYTIWSRIFLASLGCLVLLFFRPNGVMQLIHKKYPFLYLGFAGVVAGSILAFLFNDSGVVAAATAMVFGAHPMIYLILQEIYKEGA